MITQGDEGREYMYDRGVIKVGGWGDIDDTYGHTG